MLVKKELLSIPIGAAAEVKKATAKKQNYEFTAAIHFSKLKRSGKILAVDIFGIKDKKLKMRFFSDRKNFINLIPVGTKLHEWTQERSEPEWNRRKVTEQLYCQDHSAYAGKEDVEAARKFLKTTSWRYISGVFTVLDDFAERLNSEKSSKAYDRKYALEKKHFSMFPDYPKDLPRFCEKNVFAQTYIFISKIEKGKRKAVCGHCGENFTIESGIKHRGLGKCPRCGMKAQYYGEWYKSPVDKAKICITHKEQGHLLIRWADVVREYSQSKPKYNFDDYYRALYLCPNGKPTIYAYQFMVVMGYGYNWYRKCNGAVNYESTFIYTSNLRQVFGRDYYHIDLAAALSKNKQPLDFVRLLDNLKNYPVTEYLLKLRLYRLAVDFRQDKVQGRNFSEILGVSKQYLPLYQKYNVTSGEHGIIAASKSWVSEESFLKLRQLKIKYWFADTVCGLLETMSFERFVNYFQKQKATHPGTGMDELLTFYKDYINMSESMKVDLSRKSVRFPKDVKEAHDTILIRFKAVENEIIDKQFRAATKKLYAGLKDFRTDDYQIILPQTRTDFIREGQALNHCVGQESYYKNHLKGERMIFFIRKKDNPEKPYFTMEIDMKRLIILQLYGFGDCLAPSDVRKFANQFLKKLKPKKENAA